MQEITLQACECTFTIACPDERTAGLVRLAFGGLIASRATALAERRYAITAWADGSFALSTGEGVTRLPDAHELLFHLEKDLTLTLQQRRQDLFFLHGASISCGGRVAALAAPSGTGKSTLALAALDHGFEYLSDELAPIDACALRVHPFQIAPCLKVPVSAGVSSPAARCRVPLRQVASHRPQPLGALVFLSRDRKRIPGRVRKLTPASAAARLMENALNPLAHGGSGLDAAAVVAQSVPAFELDVHETGPAVEAIRSCLAHAATGRSRLRAAPAC